jgi:hypothetical protein
VRVPSGGTSPAPAGGGASSLVPPIVWASVSVSELAAGERRLEGETYLTGGYKVRHDIATCGLPTARMDTLAHIWQPPRLKGIDTTPAKGLPFLTATQVFDLRPSPRKWLVRHRTPRLSERYVQPDWILVTCSGSVGDAIVAYKPLEGMVISHDLLRVVVRDPGHHGYLYAFLRSGYSRAMLRSTKYGSIVKHLEPEHLFDVPVPLPEQPMLYDLNARVDAVFRRRNEVNTLTREAEDLYEQAVGATLPAVSHETPHQVAASALFGRSRRLDGYHYNPVAQSIVDALHATGRPIMALGDPGITARIFGVPRFKHIYKTSGIPYLDSEDLFKVIPEITKYIPEKAKKDAADYFVQRRWLLMACSGQIYGFNGTVILADTWHEEKIISNHAVRIVPSEEKGAPRPGYLQIVLGHPKLGRPLVLRLAFGSEVPEIAPQDVATLPVVRLDSAEEAAIADRVERASTIRSEADAEEDAAVRVVEDWLRPHVGEVSAPEVEDKAPAEEGDEGDEEAEGA